MLLFASEDGEVLSCRTGHTGRLDEDQRCIGLNASDGVRGFDDAAGKLKHYPYITAVALQIRRPKTAHTAHQRVYDRLVQRGIPCDEMFISLGKRGRIPCDRVGVVLVNKFTVQPERAPIMHQVDDRVYL